MVQMSVMFLSFTNKKTCWNNKLNLPNTENDVLNYVLRYDHSFFFNSRCDSVVFFQSVGLESSSLSGR